MEKALATEADGIISLPKDLLLHDILSLLSMKEVTAMSILSSDWKDICASLPNLDFDDEVWNSISNLNSGVEKPMDQQRTEFAELVNKFMTNHTYPKLQRFRLHFYPGGKYQSEAANWLKIAITKAVEHIDLDCKKRLGECFDLPSFVVESESLSSLKLKCCNLKLTPSLKGPVGLKFLRLEKVKVTGDGVSCLLSSSPHIEMVYLKHCHQIEDLKVSSQNPHFRSLTVVDCWNLNNIEIDAPYLQSFQYCGQLVEFLLKNTVGLRRVLLYTKGVTRTHDWLKIDPKVFIAQFQHVELLYLSGHYLKILYTGRDDRLRMTSSLQNLKELRVYADVITSVEVNAFLFLLQMCPNLEKLFIKVIVTQIGEHAANFIEFLSNMYPHLPADTDTREFQLNGLKMIEFKGFTGAKYESSLMIDILEKSSRLELVNLIHPPEYKVEQILENVVWHHDVPCKSTGVEAPPDSVCQIIGVFSTANPKPKINLISSS